MYTIFKILAITIRIADLNKYLNNIYIYINSKHNDIKFTFKVERNNSLPFLDKYIYRIIHLKRLCTENRHFLGQERIF